MNKYMKKLAAGLLAFALMVMLLPAGFAQQGTDSHAHGQHRNVDEDLIRHCHHPALSR